MNLAFLRAFRLRGRAISGAALLLGSLLPWQAATAANLQDSPSSRREAPPVLEEPSFYDQWLAWRLSVGVTIASSEVRHRHVTYDKTEEHNFLGNINDMHPKDDLVFGFVARYELFPSLAIEAANDFRADLEARNKDGESCDGVLELRGWRNRAGLSDPTSAPASNMSMRRSSTPTGGTTGGPHRRSMPVMAMVPRSRTTG